jgi:hypothetical protein
MQVPFEGEVELPLKGHLAFKGAVMIQQDGLVSFLSWKASLAAPDVSPCS